MGLEHLPTFVTEGGLEAHPLPLLIAQILDEKLSGMLHIEAEETRFWIYFDEGFPAGVHNPKSQDYLGSVLRELNFIDDAVFNESLMKMAQSKQLQGQVLLEMGALEEDQLERGLSLQLARKLARLFAVKKGRFQFVEDEDLPPPGEPIRVNPYALIYNAIRNTYNADDLKKGLAGVIGKSVRVSRLFVERGPLFEFPADDLAAARLLEEFRLPQEFVRSARSGPTAAMMMLLALLYCDMLEFEEADFAQPMPGAGRSPAAPAARPAGAAARAPAGGARAPAAAGRGQAAAVSADLRSKIADKFEQIKTAQPWEILEVEQEADHQRLKKAFYTLAKVYHPDRVANSGDEDLVHRMDVIITKVNEAYQILSDPHARMAYMSKKGTLDKDASGKRQPRPEEAKIQFQKAMVYFKKKDLPKAAESLRWASDLDPDNGDFLAWRHWVDFLRGEESDEVKVDRAKGDLLALAKSQPECFFAARFLARLYQHLGDKPNYEKFLVKANRINPRDVEVARELRLHQTRREKAEQKSKFLGIRFRKVDD